MRHFHASHQRRELLIDLAWMAALSLVLGLFISTARAAEPNFETFAPPVSAKMEILLTAAAEQTTTVHAVAQPAAVPHFETFLPVSAVAEMPAFETFLQPGPRTRAEYFAQAEGPRILLFTATDSAASSAAVSSAVPWLQKSQWQVDQVNAELQSELAADFGVKSLPTFVVVLDGEERGRSVGFDPAHEPKAKQTLAEVLRAAQRARTTASLK